MPRPERVKAREAARADTATEQAAEEKSAVAETIDNREEPSQSAPSGQVDEAELTVSRSVARRMGWVPLDEWKRDPAKWHDAPAYLEETPRQLDTLKERLKRTGQVTEAVAEEARQRGIKEAREQLVAATESGDKDAALAAARRLEGPPPQTVAWMARNPWFNQDPDAQLLARNVIERALLAGATIEQQLQAGEDAVKRRFPEHFEMQAEPQREAKLSEVRTPPQVQGGSRGAVVPRSKEKGWTDIPPAVRGQMERSVNRIARAHNKTVAEVQGWTAANYWREQTA